MIQRYPYCKTYLSTDNTVNIEVIDRESDDWPERSYMASCLTQYEIQRWQGYHFAQDRDYFLKTRYAAKQILAQYLDCDTSSVVWYLGEQDKPYLPHSDYQFNLSHSGHYALLAVGWKQPLGIDIESINALTNCLEIAQRFFAQEEIEQLQPWAQQPDQLQKIFFKIWTAKESIIKAIGTGLSLPLTSFAVDGRDKPYLIRLDDGNPDQWRLQQLAIDSGYEATLACHASIDLNPSNLLS